jgi:hypothetical protein
MVYFILAVVAAFLAYLAFGRRKAPPTNFKFTDLSGPEPVVEVTSEPVVEVTSEPVAEPAAEPVAELPAKKTKKAKNIEAATSSNPDEQAQ